MNVSLVLWATHRYFPASSFWNERTTRVPLVVVTLSLGKGPLLNSQCVTSPLLTAHWRVTVSLNLTSWLCGCSVKSMAAVNKVIVAIIPILCYPYYNNCSCKPLCVIQTKTEPVGTTAVTSTLCNNTMHTHTIYSVDRIKVCEFLSVMLKIGNEHNP